MYTILCPGFQKQRVVLVDHNVDEDFPLGVVVEVLDHRPCEMQVSADSSIRHS